MGGRAGTVSTKKQRKLFFSAGLHLPATVETYWRNDMAARLLLLHNLAFRGIILSAFFDKLMPADPHAA